MQRKIEASLYGLKTSLTHPFVKTSPLDNMYQDLPVVIIDDWHQVIEDFLKEVYPVLKSKTYLNQKLYAPYWIALMKNMVDSKRKVINQEL